MSMWKFYLMIAAPMLEQVSKALASKDADTVGPDDRAAAFLHYAATACTAIANDQPIPPIPSSIQ